MSLEQPAAAREVEQLQAEFPAWEYLTTGARANRALCAWIGLEKALPPELARARTSGKLIVAEIGWNKATSELRQYTDGSRAVLVSSGLITLYEAVCRFLQLCVRVRSKSGQIVGTNVDADLLVELTHSVIHEFVRRGMTYASIGTAMPGFWFPNGWNFPSVQPPDQEQINLAYEVEYGALMFLLAVHTIGPEIFLTSAPWLGLRRTYAGALFAGRIQSCLECATGTRQARVPDVETIRSWPWRSIGNHDVYACLSDIANVYDSTMEAVEARMCGRGVAIARPLRSIVVDRAAEEMVWARGCVAWFIAGGARERALGQLERITFVDTVLSVLTSLPPHLLEPVAEVVFDRVYLKAEADTDADRALTKREGEVLDDLIAVLPASIRAVFQTVGTRKR